MSCMTSISKKGINIRIPLCNVCMASEWNLEDLNGNHSNKDVTGNKNFKILKGNSYFLLSTSAE